MVKASRSRAISGTSSRVFPRWSSGASCTTTRSRWSAADPALVTAPTTSWNLADILDAIAAEIPAAPAIVDRGRELTWAQFDAQAAAPAADLDALGLERQGGGAGCLVRVAGVLGGS